MVAAGPGGAMARYMARQKAAEARKAKGLTPKVSITGPRNAYAKPKNQPNPYTDGSKKY